MLCTINPDVGAVANDQKSRYFNVLSSIHAIATAAAGTTPSNNPVNSAGTRNNSYNCITVVSNTEGGGWTAGTSNSFTNAATFNASAGAQYLDLYRTSGKSGYPWYRIAMGLYNYPFNSSFTSYPGLEYSAGCTTSNPSSVAVSSAETNWYSPLTSSMSANTPYTAMGDTTSLTSYYDYRMRFDKASKIYTVACTANYLIISNDEFLWYFGIRTVGGWEVGRTDNPPWVHFYYNRNNYPGWIWQSGGWPHAERVGAWSATINASGTQQAAALYSNYVDYQTYMGCAITGEMGNNNGNYSYPFNGNHWMGNKAIKTPIFASTLNSNRGAYVNSSSYPYACDAPVADSVTGLNVPPAYPVVINPCDITNIYFANGTCPGIYKGMAGTTAHVSNFVTGASYTIGSDTYVPVRAGNPTYWDLWFFRSA